MTHKRQRDDEDYELDISSTAATSFLGTDMKNVFAVIQAFDKVFGTSRHKLLEKSNEDAILRFYGVERIGALEVLEDLIKSGDGNILDMRIVWMGGVISSLDICVSTPGDGMDGAIFKSYEPKSIRSIQFATVATEHLKKLKQAPTSWRDDVQTLDGIASAFYNYEEDLNFISCDLGITASKKRYTIRFNNMGSISYSFLEHIMRDGRNRIQDVSADKSGVTVAVRSGLDDRGPRTIITRREMYDRKQ